ncbi:ABC transporter ATP-binding protein [Erysipelothrix urinaevulpis]|uniref:ATP-binding cassette domain-containing protein n=1 Tax=Erysipelothrix urinaevulpis TaxID=2683717 RepID=UPI00135A0347|nr:ABC transporter ATP-binding protein [Erysipelothrix urinaevulpis]
MIKVHILEKKFNHLVLKNVDLKIENNNVYGLIGLNGSGKTTLINLILGLDLDFKGNISFSENSRGIDDCFYIPSDFFLPNYLTGQEYFIYLHKLKEKDINFDYFNKLCELFFIDQNKLIEHYSYGMKKKIQFIVGILLNCKYYIFDELTSGLDIEAVLLIEKILEHHQSTFIISSHEIDFIDRISNEVLLIDNHQVRSITGNLREQLSSLSKVESLYEQINNFI